MTDRFGKLRLFTRAGALASLCGLSLHAAAANVVVTPSTPAWSVVEETATGSGQFVVGPGTPSLGAGSLQFSVGPSAGGVLARTFQEAGRRLDTLSALRYSFFVSSAPNAQIGPSIQIDVDYDASDATTAWQGRLVFDPGSYGQPVAQGAWVSYDAQAASGGWFSTGNPIVANTAQGKVCTQAATCTWAQVLASYPNAAVRPLIGGFGVKLGNFGGAGVAAVDRLVVGATTYDFEASSPPVASNCGTFDDVGANASYCGNVEWLKNRAVTLGCTPNAFCPNDNVTRAQMALFMSRLGGVLTPLPTLTQQVTGTLAVAPFAIVCQSGDVATANYARTSINQWTLNVADSATGVVSNVYPVLSRDGGATWLVYGPGLGIASGAGQLRAVAGSAIADVGAGESVRFALGLIGGAGATIVSSQCVHNAVLVNRNPADSPLDARQLAPLVDFVGR